MILICLHSSATDLFAFQGSQMRSGRKSSQPELIRAWPALLPDRLAASISSPSQGDQYGVTDDAGDANVNSMLAIADDMGHVQCFLDGSYPLGTIPLRPGTSTPSLFKHPKHPIFLAHPQKCTKNAVTTELQPTVIELPLLRTRKPRDLAKLSSTTRELVWYATRVVREMRAVWFGSDIFSGARELGPKWIRALETKQKDQFGRECGSCDRYRLTQLSAPTPCRGGTERDARFNISSSHGPSLGEPRGLLGQRGADEREGNIFI